MKSDAAARSKRTCAPALGPSAAVHSSPGPSVLSVRPGLQVDSISERVSLSRTRCLQASGAEIAETDCCEMNQLVPSLIAQPAPV